jgi:hypothetical protein
MKRFCVSSCECVMQHALRCRPAAKMRLDQRFQIGGQRSRVELPRHGVHDKSNGFLGVGDGFGVKLLCGTALQVKLIELFLIHWGFRFVDQLSGSERLAWQ